MASLCAQHEQFHRRSLDFLRFHYAQEKSHVSHIFNSFIAANMLKSLNPPKKNGGICRAWKLFFFPLFFFFFGCHKCAATFFLALQYYEPNITITTHYPRSDKTKEMAMTKWLLCGVDLFSALQLKLKQFHLFTFIAISAHITTNTHARRQWAFHKSHGFMDNLFLFIPPPPTEKQPTHNFPITRWNVCKVIVCLLITCQIYIFSNHFLLKLFFGEAGKKFLINFWNGFRNVEVDASGKEKQGSRMRCQETWRNCGIVRIFS